MQFERGPGTDKENYPILGELPAKNIDTGMGLERMAAILQGVDNLYEIDEVRPILETAADMTNTRYGAHSGHVASESHPDDVRLRVIADHVRTALMLIGDGVTPGNEGRGYVLRRILRRSIRAMRLLGWQEGPCLPQLLPVARDSMSPSYPELAGDFERRSSTPRSRRPRRRGARSYPATRRSSSMTRTGSRSTSPWRSRRRRASTWTRTGSAS
jgi:alanyl-tRNA synthetase